ncbi:MAG: AAA family ATPase [Deltaproteobacteria bacterium]|nr:MAG: AAA family ATPase [Deltaproteobacteria bacterium]
MKRIYSIGGGKGGSGKSFIATSLGVLLAKQGKRVVLVDLDLGASNLHTLLGQKIPQKGLDAFIDKETRNLEDLALPTTIPNLYLISSTKCSLEIANLFYAQKVKLISAINDLPFDYILLDLGPGTHFNTLDFFLVAPEGLFVATPEPTAIENTFNFIKSVYLRKLKLALKQTNMWYVFKEEIAKLSRGTLKSPMELVDILVKREPEKGKLFEDLLKRLKFKLILNKFRGQVTENLGEQLVDVCNRHLYPSFEFLGNISYDSRVYEAIVARHIFIRKYPYTKTVSDLQTMARTLTEKRQQPAELRISR